MTKNTEILKLVTVAMVSSVLLVGCSKDAATDETVAPSEEMKKAGPNAAAKNAIYNAKIKNLRAKGAGYEWRDTGKLIKAAEKAAANGDNDKAVALANQARDQAIAALEQSQTEADRYQKLHGDSTLGGSGDSMASGDVAKYTVVTGDNLWSISGQEGVYGNSYQWPLIYKANAAKIKDADLIFAGQEFIIPSATSAEVSAAVQHAKTRGAWTIGEAEQSDLDYVLGFK